MKYLFTLLLASAAILTAHGQQLFQAGNKMRFFYVDIKSNNATVYTIGRYLDKAGSGPSIIRTDTLLQQADSTYTGTKSRVIRENNEWYLVNTAAKNGRMQLYDVPAPVIAHTQLNHAWYLGQYFAMSEQLDKTFPLYHHEFREAFSSWAAFPVTLKEMDYLQFRTLANNRIQETKDSISILQDKYTRLTNYIIKNIREIDYAALKDSFTLLPAVYAGQSEYYRKVLNVVLVSKPAYFLQLAEDLPQQKDLIFSSVVGNKQARGSVEGVTGHDDIKKAFLKEVRYNKRFPYTAIGTVALGAALLITSLVVLIK